MTQVLQLCIVLEDKKGRLKFRWFPFKYKLLNFFLRCLRQIFSDGLAIRLSFKNNVILFLCKRMVSGYKLSITK